MQNYIKLLPDAIANKIAAGEVVQRPASAVKELLENSIDAGSSEIKLVIKDAGKTLIQVIDNGKGMSEVDARMCFERHATSKISETKDLFNISTLGFRGEALASISAIAKVELITSINAEDFGTKIIIEGSKVISQEPTTANKGSIISIKNLFYNVPARRNFLKSDNVENKHITDEFIRIALSHPEISFFLIHDNKQVFQLPKTKLSHRIVHIFGKNYENQLLKCEESTKYVSIIGYIGKPEYARKTRGDQFIFVNNRYIKSFYLNHAIKSIYKGLIVENHFPFYVLFLELNPSYIDINVHPSKAEIKFENENLVYTVLKSAVKKSLSSFNVTPSIDFSQNINSSELKLIGSIHQPKKKMNINTSYTNFKHYDKIQENNNINSEKLFFPKDLEAAEPLIKESKCFSNNDIISKSSYKIQIHEKLFLTQIKSGILLIDQNAAHQRILFETFLDALKNDSGISQQLLFPPTVQLSQPDILLLKDCYKEIHRLGFKITISKNKDIVIEGVPAVIAEKNPVNILENLLDQYKCNLDLSLDKLTNLARSLSKHTAIQHGKVLSQEEISFLIDKLFACENSKYTPDGKQIFVKISLAELLEKFK